MTNFRVHLVIELPKALGSQKEVSDLLRRHADWLGAGEEDCKQDGKWIDDTGLTIKWTRSA